MKKPVFTGAGVAIITPMYEDGSINFDERKPHYRGSDRPPHRCHHHLRHHRRVFYHDRRGAAGRHQVHRGYGQSPRTGHCRCRFERYRPRLRTGSKVCRLRCRCPADGHPYYNKTSQAGLVAHFTAMAEAGGIPVILYNVPSRTGLNIAPETALELSKHPLINGIKEASGNISQVAKVAALCGDALNIYSGNDDQVVPLLALGGKGVISVVSNVAPELVHNCCQAFFDRDTAKACALQLEMLPLEEALFCEVNPIPVKYAMNVLGWNAGECRLPLVEPSDAHKAKIEQALLAAGLIKE